MILSPDQRIAGVLAPLFCLRGTHDLGIGDTAALREFIEWAAKHGLRLLKLLPINETGEDNSPYNAISSRALEPTSIDTRPGVIEDLTQDDFERVLRLHARNPTDRTDHVNYKQVKALKHHLLEAAFERFNHGPYRRRTRRGVLFRQFISDHGTWLHHYSLFRLAMEHHGGNSAWDQWEPSHRSPEAAAHWLGTLPKKALRAIQSRYRFFCYVQWIAWQQWTDLKTFAAQKGVALMGDLPFGISFHSADVWANPTLFEQDWFGGTPPDKMFKHDPFVLKLGQNWGIPLYNWSTMREEGNFRWWRERARGVRQFFDLLRIDHILGFYRIYAFPWSPTENAEFLNLSGGEARAKAGGRLPGFRPRPDGTDDDKDLNRRDGEEVLRVLIQEVGPGRLIGEDLGEVPDYVRPSLRSLGIAGYKIPAWEVREDGRLTPGKDYERLSIAMYGTHDHDTIRAEWEALNRDCENPEAAAKIRMLCEYAGINADSLPAHFTKTVHESLLRALFQSNAWIAVVLITDLFARTERFNLPGVGEGNWTQRLHTTIAELDGDSGMPPLSELVVGSSRTPLE